MKKIQTLLLLVFLIFVFTGCNINKTGVPSTAVVNNITAAKPVTLLSEENNIFLEIPTEMKKVDNFIQIKGLTTFNTLTVEVLDSNDNILNKDDKEILSEETSDSWNNFNKYLYFFEKPQTKMGKVKIYSTKTNYVEIPITFEKKIKDGKSLEVIYPSREMTQTGIIRVIGYSSIFEGTVDYKIKKENGVEITKGSIQSTTGAPDTGIFAKDITLNIESQPVILEVFESSLVDGEEINKISLKINYKNK